MDNMEMKKQMLGWMKQAEKALKLEDFVDGSPIEDNDRIQWFLFIGEDMGEPDAILTWIAIEDEFTLSILDTKFKSIVACETYKEFKAMVQMVMKAIA